MFLTLPTHFNLKKLQFVRIFYLSSKITVLTLRDRNLFAPVHVMLYTSTYICILIDRN